MENRANRCNGTNRSNRLNKPIPKIQVLLSGGYAPQPLVPLRPRGERAGIEVARVGLVGVIG